MFPLTLDALKLRLQIPIEADDQDQVLLAAIEVARALLWDYIGAIATSPPSDSLVKVRAAAVMIAADFVNEGGINLYGFHTRGGQPRQTPVWMQMLAREARVARRRAIGGMQEEETVSVYQSLKSALRGMGNTVLTYDDAGETISIAPTRDAIFARRVGVHPNNTITAAVMAFAESSQSNEIVMPTFGANSYVYVWLGKPGVSFQRLLVEVNPNDWSNAALVFGPASAMTYAGVLGTLFVSSELQQPNQWSGKKVRVL